MILRSLRRSCLALGLLLTTAVPSQAESPVGTWRMDADAYLAQMQRIIEAMVQRVPEAQREQFRKMSAGDETIEQDVSSARIEFGADGKLTSTGMEDGAEFEGTWSEDGDRIRIDTSDSEGQGPDLIGAFDGDALVFHFDPATIPQEGSVGFMQDLEIRLLRE